MTHSVCFSATVRLLLHSNSAINVWVYGYRLREFRETFKHDCLRLPCCRSTCCRTCRCYCCEPDDNTQLFVTAAADRTISRSVYCDNILTDINTNDCRAEAPGAAIDNRNNHLILQAADDSSSRDANVNLPVTVDNQTPRERFSDLVSDSGIVTSAALTNTQ